MTSSKNDEVIDLYFREHFSTAPVVIKTTHDSTFNSHGGAFIAVFI